jgi:hypothetical protein
LPRFRGRVRAFGSRRRRTVRELGVATVRVVPPFEELEDGETGLELGREPAAVEELTLEESRGGFRSASRRSPRFGRRSQHFAGGRPYRDDRSRPQITRRGSPDRETALRAGWFPAVSTAPVQQVLVGPPAGWVMLPTATRHPDGSALTPTSEAADGSPHGLQGEPRPRTAHLAPEAGSG